MSARTAKAKPNADEHAEAAFAFGVQPISWPNPWNVFGPFVAHAARSTLTTVEGIDTVLNSWRSLMDASRAMIREQQDTALRAWHAQLATAPGAEQTTPNAGIEANALWPMNSAMKSYEQMSSAFLQAQRDALEALSRPTPLH